MPPDPPSAWSDAVLAAALLAVDPAGLGGIWVRARPGPARDLWLSRFKAFLGAAPLARVPLGVGEDRLLGGLDLTATLEAGKPLVRKGLLAEADGGAVLLAMAERQPLGLAALIAQALDQRAVTLEREGLTRRYDARFGLVALDEGEDEEEALAGILVERLAFRIVLDDLRAADLTDGPVDPGDVAQARHRLAHVQVEDSVVEGLGQAAHMLAVGSVRAEILALRAARAAAALAGKGAADQEAAQLAARLVLGPRATQMPAPPPPDEPSENTPPDDPPPDDPTQDTQPEDPSEADDPDPPDDLSDSAGPTPDQILEAVRASLPPDLLARLMAGQGQKAGAGRSARSEKQSAKAGRGRPAGVKAGRLTPGERLHLSSTLRAAAPWQRLRGSDGRVRVRPEDFRLKRLKRPAQTTTIFVVDASGSSALNRLAEAKGAIELLLADCYVRRDEIALIAFRGAGADLLLPPTRSTARAKRSLTALPGGGGTPLASAVELAYGLAGQVARSGRRPVLLFLTDGGANIARDGSPGRAKARVDAIQTAKAVRIPSAALVVDTSPRRKGDQAGFLAQALGGDYVKLPDADAASLSALVRARG